MSAVRAYLRMKNIVLKSRIKEQVEAKIVSILKEKYHENTAERLFELSLIIIEDSTSEATRVHYIPYLKEDKDKYFEEMLIQIKEWRMLIQSKMKHRGITNLDRLLSQRIINSLTEYIKVLSRTDEDVRQRGLYLVGASAAVTNNTKIEEIIQYRSSIEICKENGWKIDY